MDPRYIPILGIVLAVAIGFVKTLVYFQGLRKRRNFVSEFSSKFTEFARNPKFDDQLYSWLMHNSVAVQLELGPLGIAAYKPPAASFIIQNYEVVVNLLPELRREKTESRLFRDMDIHREHVNMCLDVLVRYQGVLQRQLQDAKGEMRNPFIWLRHGVQTILLVPLYFLHWFGLLGASTIGKLTGNIFVKSISAIVALVGLLSGVVTIIVGWEQSTKIIVAVWQNLLGP